jgi:hypothetical protein
LRFQPLAIPTPGRRIHNKRHAFPLSPNPTNSAILPSGGIKAI